MRRLLGTLAALGVAAGGALTAASPAAAAPALRFHGAQYDSPGSDDRSVASLNAEWISLINSGASAVNLKGWSIREAGGRVYTFGSVTIAGRGGRLWLHTGKATTKAPHLYWGSGNYIWNNTGDTATLRTPSLKTHHTCSWKSKAGRAWVAC